jgi:YgiT-type zinc finger domain-containing protein
MKECPFCGGKVEEIKTELSLFNGKIKINPIVGFECSSCNEIFIDEDESKRIDRITNMEPYRSHIEEMRKHQFRLRRKIGYSGRTLIVRIPKDIEQNISLREGEEIEIYPEGKNKIIIEKVS